MRPPALTGGVNIAVKVPPHLFDATIRFYRDTLALQPLEIGPDTASFSFGPNRLHVDRVPTCTHAEVWLELLTNDPDAAAEHLRRAGVTRCDAVEPLPPGFPGFWIASPAGTVHLVAAEPAGNTAQQSPPP